MPISQGPRIKIRKDGSSPYIVEKALNVIEGTGVSFTLVDDTAEGEVDLTINSTSSGASIGGLVTGGTPGSVLYIDGSNNLAQDNSHLFWDGITHVMKLNGPVMASAPLVVKDRSGNSIVCENNVGQYNIVIGSGAADEGALYLYKTNIGKIALQADGPSWINTAHNVGIGNTSPGELLDVSGNINLSGLLKFSGNGSIVQSGNFATTLTVTAPTNVTLPVSGTLVNTTVTTLSSLVSIGTIGTGVWQGTIISATYGGTGVNNGSNTVTLAGNLVTSGANSLTFTTTGPTNVTLPTSGTLVNSAVVTLSSLSSIGTIAVGTWNGTALTATYLPTLDAITAPAGNLSLNSHKIINLLDPTQPQDAASKAYVDAVAQGLSVKPSAQVATTAVLPSYTYGNGALGVGATITVTATGTLTIDGYLTALNDYILVKNETAGNAPYNGLYKVTTAGAVGVQAILTRAVEMDTSSEFTGSFVFIIQGTVNNKSGWVCASTSVVVGTTNISFTQFTGAGELTVLSPIVLSGNQISFSASYVGQTSITTLGTITTGTWNGTIISPTYGGTGVNNGSNTATLGGNLSTASSFTTSGANALTLTTTAPTNVTLPTSGTLVNSAVTTLSSLTSVGTIGTGVWQGTVVGPTYGGTGVNNGSNTVTLAGNLATSGANSLTLTTSASTNVTLPTSGTLVNSAVTTLSSLISIGTITSGVWNATAVTVPYGGTGITSATAYAVLCAGTTSTGAFQNVSGVGTSGQVLTSNGAALLPTWQTISGASSITIGNPVSSGAANGVLYEDASQNLGQDATHFAYYPTTHRINLGGTWTGDPGNTLRVNDINYAYDAGNGAITTLSTDAAAVDKGSGIVFGGVISASNTLGLFGMIYARKENSTNADPLGYMELVTMAASSQPKVAVRINSSQQVGVNCTPSYRFETRSPVSDGTGDATNAIILSTSDATVRRVGLFVGGNSTMAIGTPTNHRLDIATNNLPRITVFAGGHVAINTTTDYGQSLFVQDINYAFSAANATTILSSSDSQAANKGGALGFAGVITGTTQSVFAGVAGRKENGTDSNIAGYFSVGTAPAGGGGLVEGFRVDSAQHITVGDWRATTIAPTYGGTGVNNGSSTITLAGNLATSGANSLTLTTTATTNVTLPTSGTLVNSAVTTLSSLTSIGTITSGVWNGTALTATYLPTLDAITAPVADVSLNTHKLISVADPTNPTDADTLQARQAVSFHNSARLIQTTALASNTYANGTLGVGATLTATGNGSLSIDGVATAVNNTVIINGEATAANNGLYAVTATGDGSNPYILTRRTDANTIAKWANNVIVMVTNGATHTGSFWTSTSRPATIGTSSISFNEYAGETGIATLGTITTGTWTGTVVGATYGGTGVNNGSSTITLGGNFTTSGANTLTLTTTASTNVTLPTSGTMVDTGVCNARLTLTQGVPVTTSDVTATSIFLEPYGGDKVALFDGSNWANYTIPASTVSLALGTLADATKPYDIFLYNNSGTLTLEMLVWSTTTARATSLVIQNGVLVKSGATTRRYVGTFYPLSTTQTKDSLRQRYLWNYYNRVTRSLQAQDSTASWSYSTSSFREANGSTTNQVEIVSGYSEDTIFVQCIGAANTTTVLTNYIGIGEDSTTATVGLVSRIDGATVSALFNGSATAVRTPGIGFHYYAALESGNTGSTFYGATGSAQYGITAQFKM